jgi:oxygen-dependent protoporphyrinogen oxidase
VQRSLVVIGGGIAGLAAAWELSGGATGPTISTPRIELIEASDRLGGGIAVTDFAGYTMDLGADGFLARRPEATTLARELGLGDRLEPISASGAWLWLDGQLRAIPAGMVLGVPVTREQVRALEGLSRGAKMAAWRDWYRPRKLAIDGDTTIGAIVRAKLGDELALRVVEPMIGGIQAGRIDDLSARSVFPALLEAAARGGSLMRALAPTGPVNPGPRATTSDGPAFFTLTSGVGSLADELRTQLVARGVLVRTATPVRAIRRTPNERHRLHVDTDTTTTPADAVIVATPAPIAAQLIGEELSSLARIDAASASMVSFVFASDAIPLPATGTGVLVPLSTPFHSGDSMMITAVTFLDRKWPHLRRDERVLVRVHVGRSDDQRHLALSDEELTGRIARELALLFPGVGHPLASRVQRWRNGLPQYRVGHEELVAAARASATPLGIHLAGNAYDGVGIPASIGSGRRAAIDALS